MPCGGSERPGGNSIEHTFTTATTRYYHTTTRAAWTERPLACATCVVGVGAAWTPPLTSLAVLDAILIVTAAVPQLL